MKQQSDRVSRNSGNVDGRFGRDGMRFGWDLKAKGLSGIWFVTQISGGKFPPYHMCPAWLPNKCWKCTQSGEWQRVRISSGRFGPGV